MPVATSPSDYNSVAEAMFLRLTLRLEKIDERYEIRLVLHNGQSPKLGKVKKTMSCRRNI